MDLPHNLHDSQKLRDYNDQNYLDLGFQSSSKLHDQSQHPPYIPQSNVAGFAPEPVIQIDGADGGADFKWNYGQKRMKEHDFFEKNSQKSSINFWQSQSVSTGLGLSLDKARIASSASSSSVSFLGDDIDRELRRQDADIGTFLKIQGDKLRRDILNKIQSSQHQTVSLMEEIVMQKLHEKDKEIEIINRNNKELEIRIKQQTMQAETWQQRAKYGEYMIDALNYNLERVQDRLRDSIEGCGEVDNAGFCAETIMCKSCGVKEVCMLLLPCKHLCLCKDCESKLNSCPLCWASKILGMEIYM